MPGKLKPIHCQVETHKKMSFGGAHVCGLALLAMGGRPKRFFSLKTLILPWGRILDFNPGFSDGPQTNGRACEKREEVRCGFGSQNSCS